MTEFLVIRLTPEEHPVEWAAADNAGNLTSAVATGTLEQAAEAAAGKSVIALVPAEDVLTTAATIPARSSAKVRAALPFALEEDLAEDIEELHFCIGQKRENGQYPVAVVSLQKMQAWLLRLNAAGISPQRLVPLSAGLAKIPGTLSLLVDGDTILFNDGADKEFVVQSVKPSDALVLAGVLDAEDAAEQPRHLVAFCTSEDDERLSHDWIALRHELDSVDVNVLTTGVLSKLATTVASGAGINLLQGMFGKKTEYGALFRPWKFAAVLLLGFMLVLMIGKGLAYRQLIQDEAALRAQFTMEYQKINPGDTRQISDPEAIVRSLRSRLGGSGAPQVFLPGMTELAKALAGNEDIDVEAINFRAGIIDLRLVVPDVEALDKIQQAITASGRFSASIERTDQLADKIDGRIRIREGG